MLMWRRKQKEKDKCTVGMGNNRKNQVPMKRYIQVIEREICLNYDDRALAAF